MNVTELEVAFPDIRIDVSKRDQIKFSFATAGQDFDATINFVTRNGQAVWKPGSCSGLNLHNLNDPALTNQYCNLLLCTAVALEALNATS